MERHFCDRCKKQVSKDELCQINASVPLGIIRNYIEIHMHCDLCYSPSIRADVCLRCMSDIENMLHADFIRMQYGSHRIKLSDVAKNVDVRKIENEVKYG